MADSDSDRLLGVAADHATTRIPTGRPDQQVTETRAGLDGTEFDSVDDVAVLDGSRLVGVISIERLLASNPERTLSEVMDPDPPVVSPGVNQEVAPWRMVRHGESSLGVVDEDRRFVGLIPPRRMLKVLLAEHDEGMARLGGFMAGTRRAREAAEEAVGRRILHRLPWLVIGLFGAMISAIVVGAFESQLDERVILVFFLPAVVYMADAVAAQTEAVVIRGLSVGVKVRGIIRSELISGALLGLAVGAAFIPFAALGFGESDVALAVGLALFASCSIATVVALFLPWGLQRLGRDPAFGSGPLATVIEDLLSIAVYLAIATPIAT